MLCIVAKWNGYMAMKMTCLIKMRRSLAQALLCDRYICIIRADLSAPTSRVRATFRTVQGSQRLPSPVIVAVHGGIHTVVIMGIV